MIQAVGSPLSARPLPLPFRESFVVPCVSVLASRPRMILFQSAPAARPSQARFVPFRSAPAPGIPSACAFAPLEFFFCCHFRSVQRRCCGTAFLCFQRPGSSLAPGASLRGWSLRPPQAFPRPPSAAFGFVPPGVCFHRVPRFQLSLRRSTFCCSGLPVHRQRRPPLHGRRPSGRMVMPPSSQSAAGEFFSVCTLLIHQVSFENWFCIDKAKPAAFCPPASRLHALRGSFFY